MSVFFIILDGKELSLFISEHCFAKKELKMSAFFLKSVTSLLSWNSDGIHGIFLLVSHSHIIIKTRGGSRAAAISMMECFVIMVNGLKPLTITPKHSILDVAAALDPPLKNSYLVVTEIDNFSFRCSIFLEILLKIFGFLSWSCTLLGDTMTYQQNKSNT